MSWTRSLIRLSGYEVETLQKRLAEIAGRAALVDAALAALDIEEAAETERGRNDAQAGWYLIGFRDGCRARRARLNGDAATLELESQGVRDALAQAFESQKKYEHVADAAAVTLARAEARVENAAFDELARRRGSA